MTELIRNGTHRTQSPRPFPKGLGGGHVPAVVAYSLRHHHMETTRAMGPVVYSLRSIPAEPAPAGGVATTQVTDTATTVVLMVVDEAEQALPVPDTTPDLPLPDQDITLAMFATPVLYLDGKKPREFCGETLKVSAFGLPLSRVEKSCKVLPPYVVATIEGDRKTGFIVKVEPYDVPSDKLPLIPEQYRGEPVRVPLYV